MTRKVSAPFVQEVKKWLRDETRTFSCEPVPTVWLITHFFHTYLKAQLRNGSTNIKSTTISASNRVRGTKMFLLANQKCLRMGLVPVSQC